MDGGMRLPLVFSLPPSRLRRATSLVRGRQGVEGYSQRSEGDKGGQAAERLTTTRVRQGAEGCRQRSEGDKSLLVPSALKLQ